MIQLPLRWRCVRPAATLIVLAILCAATVRAQDAATLFSRGQTQALALDITEARNTLREALRIDPSLPGLREYTAWFLYSNGFQDRECLDLFESVATTASDPAAVGKAIAHLRHTLGMEGGAAPAPVQRPSAPPDSANLPARLQYARELFWSGSPVEASAILDELIAAKPAEPALRLEKAKVLQALGDIDGARRELESARRMCPDDPTIAAALVAIAPVTSPSPARLAKKPAVPSRTAARLQQRPAVAGGPAAAALFRSGRQAAERLDLFGARDDLRAALQRDPSLPGLREYTAWLLFLNGFHDRECLGLFEQVRKSASDPRAVDSSIAMLRQELGLEQSVPRDPVPRPYKVPAPGNLPARLQYARELFWSGSPQDAQPVIEQLVAKKPDEPFLRLQLARVLIARNKYREAAEELAAARKLRPQEPEVALELAKAEALRGRRTAALRALRDVEFPDEGPIHLVRARAYHYAGEFMPASHEYRRALASRPYDEIAAHGLAETTLRTGAVPEARALLAGWPDVSLVSDWSDRQTLEREVAAPRVRAGGSYFGNSLTYRNWNAGADFRFRPIDALEIGLSAIHGWFLQDGFSDINRQTGALSVVWQPGDVWALSGHVGVNGYSTGWTSAAGGVGLMVRPFSTLQLNINADHLDVVDSEPWHGIALYDMAATIGAAGGQATMDALAVSATWNPLERVEVFGKYKIASVTSNNTLNDYYASASYKILRNPKLLAGYGISQTMFSEAAPVFVEGTNSTSYYYDPKNLIVQNFYAEFAQDIGKHFSWGGEAHLYQQPLNGGVGTGLFSYLKFKWADNQALRVDARWFSQDRGLNRDGTASGSYSALNLVAIYEYSF